MRSLADRLIRLLVRVLLGAFYRRLEVVGAERVPAEGPLILVANHINSLMDPAMLVQASPRMPRFLAKSTLWKNPAVRPFLDLARAIPVYRRQDPGVDTSKNQETFARCHELLRDGGAVGLFPEGTSHNDPSLKPLRTGAARIALEAESRFGPLGIRVVPVGLIFEDKRSFRSRALIHVGEPLGVLEAAAGERRAGAEPQRVDRLTESVAGAMDEVLINYQSWKEARLVERGADLYGGAGLAGELPSDLQRAPSLAERFSRHRAFLEGYRQLKESSPEEVEAAADAVADYQRLLDLTGLSDEQVGARYPWYRVAGYLVWTLVLTAVRLPLALLGTLIHYLPYHLPAVVASYVDSDDLEATYKVMTAMVFFPLTWLLVAGVTGVYLGWPAGLAMLVVAPASGWVALRFFERQRGFLREARAFLLLRTRNARARELRRRRSPSSRDAPRSGATRSTVIWRSWWAWLSATAAGTRASSPP